MASLSVTYLDDLARVRIQLIDGLPGVRYRVQRSTADDPTWVVTPRMVGKRASASASSVVSGG